MKRKSEIRIGDVFGRLTLIKYINTKYCLYRCVCGKEKIIVFNDVRRGKTKSCGCLTKEIKHGHTINDIQSKEYICWRHIKGRCINKNNPQYKYYGERGIKICERWLDFSNFLLDMGKCPSGLSIDRIDNNGDYTPENCRWASMKEQSRNKRTNKTIIFNGIKMIKANWIENWGINKNNFYSYLRKGKTMEWIYENKVIPYAYDDSLGMGDMNAI